MKLWVGRWQRWGRPLVLSGLGAAIGWVAFVAHRPVPLLDWFDLAIHEAGHLFAFALPELAMFLAGSVAQVAFPLGMALYFALRRRDLAAGGFCLAWAGTSAWDVSVYAADAPIQALPLIGGGQHDWAYILGRFDAVHRADDVAGFIEAVGAIAVAAGVILSLTPLLRREAPRKASIPSRVRTGVKVRSAQEWPAGPNGDPWFEPEPEPGPEPVGPVPRSGPAVPPVG